MQHQNSVTHFQRALQYSEEKYHHLTQLMPIAVFSTDENGLITFYNEQAAKIWGRRPRLNDPQELLYCGSWKLFTPDGDPMPHDQCPMAKAVRFNLKFRNEEIAIERPDGTRMAALVNIDPTYGPDGNLNGAINVFHDITDRKKSQEIISRLAAIVESSKDAIISTTIAGEIISWNKGAEVIFGYMEKEILGQNISMLYPLQDRLYNEDIVEKIQNNRTLDSFEIIAVAKNRKKKNISLTISPVKNNKGEIIGLSHIARDISEMVETREKLLLYNEKLQQLNKYKDDFISIASHELKTPLTVLKIHLQLMERGVHQEPYQLYIAKAKNQVDKLNHLIIDLLDVSKLESGKLELHYTSFNLVDLIRESIESIQVSVNHKIRLSKGPEVVVVNADKQRIEQVIINLLNNAVKYSPDQSNIDVAVKMDNDSVTVAVADSGIGIPSDQHKLIFSRFYRVNESASTNSGMGIGLFISQEITERHGGKMWVESEYLNGSTFYFQIPSSGIAPD